MKKGGLILACEDLIKKFDPKKMTLDSHAAEVLGDCESANADANSVFIKQVFYGCVRNKPALKAFMSQFYNDMAASVLRADYTLYLILAYLTIFRLEELTFQEYRKFIESQEPDKMSVFLSYIFDVPRLTGSVKWDWLKIFDLEYVESDMLRPIAELAGAAETMRLEMLAKASGLAAEKDTSEGRAGIPELPKRQLTKPVSPRLTKPAPRAVPAPEKITQEVVAGKEPRYLELTSVEQIETEKAARRELELEKTMKKYSESKVQPFALHETRNTLRASRREAEQKAASTLEFESKPGPAVALRLPSKKAEFRMNTAAYLREDSLYKRKQDDEVKIIQAYESELRDSTEYYQWQMRMREKDLKDRREQVERVRTLAKLSAEEAQQAMEKQRMDNASIAARIKAESTEMEKQRNFEADMNRVMNQQLVKEVIQVREHAPKEAQSRMLEQRKERRDAIHDEITTLLVERKEEEKREQAKREERARQLKAIHEVHPTGVKVFDPTESIGIGLLDEMSLMEMKERLAIERVRAEEQEKSKRSDIISRREKQQQNLRKRIENIERIRSSAAGANKEARDKHKAKELAEVAQREVERNAANLKLLEELDAKRAGTFAEREALRIEDERRRNAQAFGGQGLWAVEEMHFAELLKGAEREAEQRQSDAQVATRVYEETKADGRAAVATLARTDQARKRRFFVDQAEEIERKRKELMQKQKEEIVVKKTAFLQQRVKHKEVKERIVALNPYAQSLTDASRTKREKQSRTLQAAQGR